MSCNRIRSRSRDDARTGARHLDRAARRAAHRTRAGRSVFAPDKQHLHHRLLEIGHSHGRAVFLMWVWAALVSFGLVVIALVGGWTAPVVIGLAVVLTVLVTTGHPRALLGNSR